MSSTSSLRFLARALSGRLNRSLGVGGALVGFGYGLSFDKPLSYIPYGVCRSYEGISEALPGLRDRRLGVYDRASRFAERWRMESPFLNAYLLDRLCRESVTRHRTLLLLPLDPSPPVPSVDTPSSPLSRPLPEPKVETVVKPTQQLKEAPKTADSPSLSKESSLDATGPPSSSESSSNPLPSDEHSSSSFPVPTPSNDPIRPSLVNQWSESISEFSQRSRRRFNQIISPSFLIAKSHDLLFPGAAKEPSFLSVLDRVHHLTTSLEPYCTDVDRLRSVYITVANFLNFSVQQKAFHEQLFHESSLEHDKLILQFFHTSLLATHRMEYLNEYERLAVTPAPPPSLPTGDLSRTPAPTVWKRTTTKTTSAIKGLVSNFSPNSDQKPVKIAKPSVSASPQSPSISSSEEALPTSASVLHRRRPNWTAQDAALDCRQKLRNVWRVVGGSRLLKDSARRTVWRGDYQPSHLEQRETLQGSYDDANRRTPAQMLLESKIIKENEEVIGLTGAIRTLVQDFNRTPTTANDLEVCFEMNKALQTPLTLNPFGEQYSPHRCSQFIQKWILHGPLIPFILGAAVTAIYLSPTFMEQINKSGEPFLSRLWSAITSLFDDNPQSQSQSQSHPHRSSSQSSTNDLPFNPPQSYPTDTSAFYGLPTDMNPQSLGYIPSTPNVDGFSGFGVSPAMFVGERSSPFGHPDTFLSAPHPDVLMQRGFGLPDPSMMYNRSSHGL